MNRDSVRHGAGEADAVAAADERWLEAFNRADVDGLLALYADDAVVLPDGEPEFSGKPAIREWFEAFFREYSASQTIDNTEFVVAGDWAYMRGSWALTREPREGDGEPEVVEGKHLVIWRRGPGGSWRVARDIWNGNGS